MNRIYRLVFNRALGQVQVASELAGAAGGSAAGAGTPRARLLALCVAVLCAAPVLALAATLPGGGTLAQGSASIGISPDGNTLTVTQGSPRALINWNSFSIGTDGVVIFNQPSANALALNVVQGSLASQIDGSLLSNGQVFLINQNGIVFGGNASVNVGGLVASSLPLTLGDAESGLWNVGSAGTSSTTSVRNIGNMTATGSISLVGAGVSNTGFIGAKAINLVAGGRNEIRYDDATGLFSARVLDAAGALALSSSLINSGTLHATNVFLDAWGPVQATVINSSGTVIADGIDPGTGSLVVHATNGAVNLGYTQAHDLAIESHGNGSVTGSGQLRIAGTTSVNTDGNIALNDAQNDFGGAVTLDGAAVSLTDTGGLELAGVNAGSALTASTDGALRLGSVATSGNAVLTGAAGISQSQALVVGGSTQLVSGGAIVLDNAGNQLAGATSVQGLGVSLSAAGSLELASVDATSLSATSDRIILSGAVDTTAGQAYHGAVVVSGNIALGNIGNIVFDGSVDGSGQLTLANSGQTRFEGGIGGTSMLGGLQSSADNTVVLGGDLQAIGNVDINGALLLVNADTSISSLGNVRLGGTIDGTSAGGQALAVSAAGVAALRNAGLGTPLASLGVSAGTRIELGGSLNTVGQQRYQGNVVLTGNTVATSTGNGQVRFDGSIDGPYALAVNTAGLTAFDGALGAGTPLASLVTDAAGSSRIGVNVSATGNIAFGDALSLLGPATVASSAGRVAFAAIDAPTQALTASSAGGTTFGGDASLSALSVAGAGPVTLGGDITTTGAVDFASDVLLADSVTVRADDAHFGGRIDGHHALALANTGLVRIDGEVGGNTALAGLDISAANLQALGIHTAGDLRLAVSGSLLQNGAYAVEGDAAFSSTGDLLLANLANAFGGKVSLAGRNAILKASTGLDLDQVTLDSLDAGTLAGRLALDHASIGAGGATLSGAAIDLGTVAVGGNLDVTGSSIGQHGALDITGSTRLDAGSGDILLDRANRFAGAVSLVGGSARINATAASTLTLDSVAVHDLTASAGQVALLQDIHTDGYQAYAGALSLGRDTSLTAGGTLGLAGSIDGPFSLSLIAAGMTTISGDVGQLAPLSGLSVTGPATLDGRITTRNDLVFGGGIELAGDSTLTSRMGDIEAGAVEGAHALTLSAQQGSVSLGTVGASRALDSLQVNAAAAHLAGGSITTTGAQSYAAPVMLGGDLVLSSTAAGNITLGRVDGSHALAVNTAGQTRFDGAIGNDLFLTSLSTDAAGSTRLAGSITALGNIALNDVVVLAAASRVQSLGGAATFAGTVTGPWGLAVNAVGGARFGGALDIGSLSVAGNGITRVGGDVTVATSAQFDNPLLLTGEVDMRGQVLDFRGGIDGAYALGLVASQSVSVAGGLGAATPLASLSVVAPAFSAGAIATSGDLALDIAGGLAQTAAYRVGGNAVFHSGGDITLTAAGNRFDGSVALSGARVGINGSTGLDLDQVQAASLNATANGSLQLANARVQGDTSLAGATIGFNAVTIGGTLAADSGGAVDQTGALQLTGDGRFSAGGDIRLADAGNRFEGTLDLQGRAVTLAAGDDLAIARLANGANQAVDLRAGGNLMLATAVDTGTAALGLAADGGSLVIDGALSGGQVRLAGRDGIAIGADIDAAGLSLTSQAGAIGQQAGNLRVDGVTDVDSGTGAIQLASSGNHFAGAVNLHGGAVVIGGDTLQLGTLSVAALDARAGNGLALADGGNIAGDAVLDAGTGALALGATAIGGDLQARGAAISQQAALVVAGASRFDSAGDIALDNADNRFGGGVALQGGQATIAANGDLSLAQVQVTTLRANASGALRLADATVAGDAALAGQGIVLSDAGFGGSLQAASGAALGQQGAVRVAGDSRLAAADAIVLDNAGNDFQGAVSASGGMIALADANDLRIGALDNRGGGTGIAPAALALRPLASGGGDVTLVAGGTLTLPAQAIDIGNATLTLQSNGGRLAVQQALSAGDIFLAGRDGMSLGADITAANALDLRSSAGAITQGSGRLGAALLTGQAGGAVSLQGDNRIAALGDFGAASLSLANGASLAVTGNVQAGSAALLDVRGGDLRIEGSLAAEAVRLQSAGSIGQGAAGSIATAALSGRSAGATRLGGADGFIANRVARLGDFSAAGGFSLTNATTLTLASLNGSDFSVDAGDAAFFLKVDGGDLLQAGTTPVHAGDGRWWSSGRIGTAQAPIYVVTRHPTQVVDFIGVPPAYFYAIHPDGTPVQIGGAVNLPTTAVAARAQSGSLHRVAYIDVGALNAPYRAFGIVKPGIRLPLDQIPVCDAGDPDADCAQ